MKRMTAVLLALTLCFTTALAVPPVPYRTDTLLRYHRQTPAVQNLVDILYDGAMNFQTEITLPPNTAYHDAETAVDVLRTDFPEIFQLKSTVSLRYYQHEPDVCTAVILEYAMDEQTYLTLRTQTFERAWSFMPDGAYSDFTATVYLHDMLAANTAYPAVDGGHYDHEAYGALVYGSSVCEGYAQALTLLYRFAGIPCSMVVGTAYTDRGAGSHAWNVVQLGGELFLTDCTYNDQDHSGTVLHWYLNLPYQDMTDHVPDENEYSISSSRNYTYHAQMGGWIGSADDIERVFLYQANMHRQYGFPMEFRCADASILRTMIASLGDLLYKADIGHVTYQTNDTLLTVTITEKPQ